MPPRHALAFAAPNAETQINAYARCLSLAFGRTSEQTADWMSRMPRGDMRVLTDRAGSVPAGLLRVPMGQFFGGKSVPMMGIAAVATAPEARGRGLALELMRRALVEIRQEGVPLSSLYPATLSLYRRCGYELAGHRFAIRVPLSLLPITHREPGVRAMVEADMKTIEGLYRAYAANLQGHLDRAPSLWTRLRLPRGEKTHAFVVESDERKKKTIEGWIFYKQQPAPPNQPLRYELYITEMTALTPRSARRLWSFLASHATMGSEAVLFGGPNLPVLSVLPEQAYTISLQHHWMLRLVDVKKALEARGYSPHARAGFALRVRDETLKANEGVYAVEIEGGRAGVKKTTRAIAGAVEIDARTLAAVYSGFWSPLELAAGGQLMGDAPALAAMHAAFAGGTPSMPDMF